MTCRRAMQCISPTPLRPLPRTPRLKRKPHKDLGNQRPLMRIPHPTHPIPVHLVAQNPQSMPDPKHSLHERRIKLGVSLDSDEPAGEDESVDRALLRRAQHLHSPRVDSRQWLGYLEHYILVQLMQHHFLPLIKVRPPRSGQAHRHSADLPPDIAPPDARTQCARQDLVAETDAQERNAGVREEGGPGPGDEGVDPGDIRKGVVFCSS